MDTTASDPLLTTAEAAKYLNANKSLLYRLYDAGKIEHVRLSTNTYRVRQSVLDAWLAHNTVPAENAV